MTQIPYICFHHVTFFLLQLWLVVLLGTVVCVGISSLPEFIKHQSRPFSFQNLCGKLICSSYGFIYLFSLKKFKFYILAPVTPPLPFPIPNFSHPTPPSLLRGSHPERLISSGLFFISVLVIFCLATFSILSLFCTLLLLFMWCGEFILWPCLFRFLYVFAP